jgi:hypothetical protein
VATKTGNVIVTTDSAGHLSTYTTDIGPLCTACTEYTIGYPEGGSASSKVIVTTSKGFTITTTVSCETETVETKAKKKAETDISTTVVTVTSCSSGKCAAYEVTTGVTTVTKPHYTYTTYCPLSESQGSPAESPENPKNPENPKTPAAKSSPETRIAGASPTSQATSRPGSNQNPQNSPISVSQNPVAPSSPIQVHTSTGGAAAIQNFSLAIASALFMGILF